MTASSSRFFLSGGDVSFGTRECYSFLVDQTAADLDGTYFNIDVPSANFEASSQRYVWFNLDAGSVDPAPVGRTALEVAISTGDSATDIASAIVSAASADSEFRAKIDPNLTIASTVILEANFKGAVDAVAADVDTNLTLNRNRVGLGGDLGATQGGVNVTFDQSFTTITADQTGEIPQDQILQGQTVSVSMSLLETTPANWERVVGSVVGDTYTPPAGTKLVGVGTSKVFQSVFSLGGELVIHPTKNDASDKSEDLTFWLCAPVPSEIGYSGTDPQVLNLEFQALQNPDVRPEISIYAYGDGSQDVLV